MVIGVDGQEYPGNWWEEDDVECPRCGGWFNPHLDKRASYAEFVDGILCGECADLVRRVTGGEP